MIRAIKRGSALSWIVFAFVALAASCPTEKVLAQQSACANLFKADSTIIADLIDYRTSVDAAAKRSAWLRVTLDGYLQPAVVPFPDCDDQTKRLNYLASGLVDTFAMANGSEPVEKPTLDSALRHLCLCDFSGATDPGKFATELSSYGLDYSTFEWAARRLYALYRTNHLAVTPTDSEDAFLRYWVPAYAGS